MFVFVEVEDRLGVVRKCKGREEVKIGEVGYFLQNIGGQDLWYSVVLSGDGRYEVTVYLGLMIYGNQW